MRARAETAPEWARSIAGPRDLLPAEIQEYLDWLRIVRNRPATTVRSYRAGLAKFAAFLQARPHPDGVCAGIDRHALRRYQIELADVLPYPRSRARDLVALRGFLRYAHDEGLTARDWSGSVVLPRFLQSEPHPLRAAGVPKLLAALPRTSLRDHRDRALVHLLLSTGCRIAEACSLDRTDVRRDGFRVLGKGGKYRTVYLTAEAFAAVRDYLAVRGPDDSPALFIGVSHRNTLGGRPLAGNRLGTDGARVALADLRRRMGEEHPELREELAVFRSPHVARHTLATTLLEATDGDVRLVQEVLGHATLETLRVYTEITDSRKRAAYERFGEYLRWGRHATPLDWAAWLSGEQSTCGNGVIVSSTEDATWTTTTAA